MASAASAARSSMVWSSQSPGAPPTPGLFQDREVYPARAKDSQSGWQKVSWVASTGPSRGRLRLFRLYEGVATTAAEPGG